jgi:hypothetical protein
LLTNDRRNVLGQGDEYLLNCSGVALLCIFKNIQQTMKLYLAVIALFYIGNAQAQVEAHYKYWDGGFCSKNIFLKADGSFYYQEGCEGDSKICKGKYNIKDSILYLEIDTSRKGRLSYEVSFLQQKPEDSIFITVLDINKTPVPNFRIGLLPVPSKDKPFMSEVLETDVNGFIKVIQNDFTHFISQHEIELQNDINWIQFNADKNVCIIRFNYPYTCLKYNRIEWYDKNIEPLRFRNGELYNKKLKYTR